MKPLKKDYNSTIVSMTDVNGKTGNVDYRDCKEPTDDDLVAAAKKYGLSTGIRFTVTTSVGVKIRFTGSIKDNKLIRETDENRDLYALRRAAQALYLEEKEKLEQYKDCDFTTQECLDKFNLQREHIEAIVEERKKSVWRLFASNPAYDVAMFNYILVELVTANMIEGGA